MTNTTRRIIFMRKFAAFTQIATAMGLDFIVTTFHRTAAEQRELYEEGKSQCDGETVRSKHQDWLAIDIVLIANGEAVWQRTPDYDKLGYLWTEVFGGVWGGNWASLNDIYHFQYGGE